MADFGAIRKDQIRQTKPKEKETINTSKNQEVVNSSFPTGSCHSDSHHNCLETLSAAFHLVHQYLLFHSSMPESLVLPVVKPILKKDSNDSTDFVSSSYYKKVWFDSVAINYHKMILGDNPAVSDGAPVTIGWDAHEMEVVDVECFEATRPKKAKKLSSLKLAVEDRAAILLENGYTIKQLAKTLQQVEEIQRQRAQSCEMSKWDRLNEFAESSGKIFRKMAKLTPVAPVTSRPSKKANPAA